MEDGFFYSAGLRFSCARCSTCCRKESGFVYLSENDLSALAQELQMEYADFVNMWCRWVPFERGRERLSLREKSNYDCIFWKSGSAGDDGCSVYNVRPLQCRTFPFWDYVLGSQQAWTNAGKDCPGIGSGEYHEAEKIKNLLRLQEEELIIERNAPRPEGM